MYYSLPQLFFGFGMAVRVCLPNSTRRMMHGLNTTAHGGGEGNGSPLQCSCLENPMDGGAWWAAVHGVAQSRTRLSNFTFTFHFPALEKAMAAHSSALAWRIPWTEEPGGLLSMGSHRVGHDWSDLAAAALGLSPGPFCVFYVYLFVDLTHSQGLNANSMSVTPK